MIFRSLRWRLALAMALIIAAVFTAAGVFSSIAVTNEFNRYLIAQRRDEAEAAARMLHEAAPGALHEALLRVQATHGFRSVVFDAHDNIVDRVPADLARYQIRLMPDGLHLDRREGGMLESMVLRTEPVRVGELRVVFLPPRESSGRVFRSTVNRRLVVGVVISTLLAVVVMMTLFRRVFAPVEALTRGAHALAQGRLDTRVDVHGGDEVAELASTFNSMAAALERNETARRNMVNDVAHELRTPLTNIRTQIEAAQDGVMAVDDKWLASIAEDALLLSQLVDDLQQLALAEAGQLRLEIAEVEVAELVERAVSGLTFGNLTRDIPPNLTVRVDARRMVQVLRNLLVNAIRHARGAVHISASQHEIRVADDGPGVPAGEEQRIFDRFYRVDASRSRSTGGAGLGLAIAKQLVELHGGTIRYERPAFIISL